MDLVAGVRKEGSRGGRGEFKWSDVKDSSHRENYLGHSLMAPVGRWQENRDLSWYSKSGGDDAKQERAEEIRRVKEAEQEAMALALGLPVAPKTAASNANNTPLGGREIERAVQEGRDRDDSDGEGARGIGFGGFNGMPGIAAGTDEKMEAVGIHPDDNKRRHKPHREDRGRERREDREEGRRRRGRSRDDRDDRDERRERRRERRHHRSPDHRERRRYRSGSRSRSRDKQRRERERHRHHPRRSQSPHDSRRSRHDRYPKNDQR